MGVAVLAGVVDSLDVPSRMAHTLANNKWESHTPGTLTPTEAPDSSTPTRFIACVSRETTAIKLRSTFNSLGSLAQTIHVVASQNLASVQQSDVVLLW